MKWSVLYLLLVVYAQGQESPQARAVPGTAQAPRPIKYVPPEYPKAAKDQHIQGTVRFTVVIGKDGTVKNLELISGPPLLVKAASEAIKQWVYKPILINGQPEEVRSEVALDFGQHDPQSGVQTATLIKHVAPIYPQLARERHIQGTVRFTGLIGKDGKVKNLELISGPSLLVNAAREAVKQWVYQPILNNGQPEEVKNEIAVDFSMQ